MQIVGTIVYERLEKIGVGQGMNSTVWKARDLQSQGIIAVKEISKTILKQSGITNIFNEAEQLFSAQHKHVVPILYCCDVPNQDFVSLAMPFYKNGSLQDRLLNGPLPLHEAIRIGLAMLTGLGTIHSKDLVHFDIKPANILFNDNDDPLIADFGQTRSAALFGKVAMPPMYPDGVPPEFYGTGVGQRESDIYQAGLTLYRAVNGHPHFLAQKPTTNDQRRELTISGKFPRRDRFLPHVPRRMKSLIVRALNLSCDSRFRSAADMWNALANCTIKHNWLTTLGANGECRWSCRRDGHPGIDVELSRNGKGWDVYTFKTGARRARWNKHCLGGAKLNDASRHLRLVFAELD